MECWHCPVTQLSGDDAWHREPPPRRPAHSTLPEAAGRRAPQSAEADVLSLGGGWGSTGRPEGLEASAPVLTTSP